ncbi:MAG: hypothetical protein ACT4P4_29145 [Betaproteobacteria bacterium]
MNFKNGAAARQPVKRGRAADWTLERVAQMSVKDIKQLRENAERLNEPELAAVCNAALKGMVSSRKQARRTGVVTRARHLVARIKAFEARGVYLRDPRTSWGGERKSDGAVVLALWADAVQLADGGCRYLLWAPNVDGSRPWSDKPAGKERLDHCRRAIERGRAEGLLVYGVVAEGWLPEDKADAIHGVDADTVLAFEVQAEGDEYWATWGRKTQAAPPGTG